MTNTTINGIDLTTITVNGIEKLNLKNLQAIAKNLKVKNWWTMKKANLITAVSPLIFELQVQDKHPEKKARKAKKEKKDQKDLDNLVTLKDLAFEFGMKPAKARRILRSSFGLISTSEKTRWEWTIGSEELLKVRAILNDKTTTK